MGCAATVGPYELRGPIVRKLPIVSHSVGRRFGSSGVPAGRWRGPGGPWVTRGPGKRRRGGGRALVVVMWPVVVAVVPGPGGALKASHPPSVCGLFLSRRPLWAGKKHRARRTIAWFGGRNAPILPSLKSIDLKVILSGPRGYQPLGRSVHDPVGPFLRHVLTPPPRLISRCR